MKQYLLYLFMAATAMPGYANGKGQINQGIGNYSHLAVRWWQYMVSIPVTESPSLDTTGTWCGIGQNGKVWFLGGNFSSGAVTRECTLSSNKRLFFPVGNTFNINGLCLQNNVDLPDHVESTSVTIDGKDIDAIRSVKSVKFDVALPQSNILGLICKDGSGNPVILPRGFYTSAMSSGYYVLLDPLPVGFHTLQITGNDADGNDGNHDIIYNLTVVPAN